MKKFFSVLISIVLLVSYGTGCMVAHAFEDTEGRTYDTAVEVLSGLGIVEGDENGNFNPEKTLSRAELVTIILRFMNVTAGNVDRSVFADVPPTHWSYANVHTAYEIGIVNGVDEKLFCPDENVTYAQAVKMVVAALGYTVWAESAGGYPTGYLTKAQQLGILNGVSNETNMNRGNMAVLIYNALDVPLFEKTSFGEDSFTYSENAERTALSVYLKVSKCTDRISQTSMMRLTDTSETRRLLSDEVAVGSLILKVGKTNAQELFGVRSDIYYKIDDVTDYPLILSIVPRAGTEIAEVSAQNIDDGATTADLFTYEDIENNVKKVSINNAALIYNGRLATKDAALLTPDIGTVTLIYDGGECELIIVWEYKSYVVDMVEPDNNKVYFKPNADGINDIIIDLTDNSIPTEFLDGEGAAASLSLLAEWDVMSVAESEGTQDIVRKIRCSYDMVVGTVTEFAETELSIDDTTFAIAPSLAVSGAVLGQSVACYLDFTGAVAAIDTAYSTGRTYGWLKSADTTKGLGGEPRIRLFTESGEWKVFQFEEYVKFNGVRTNRDMLLEPKQYAADTDIWYYDTAPSLMRQESGNAASVIPQMVAYKLNADGRISELETATNKSSLSHSDSEKLGGEFSLDWYLNNTRKSRGFNGTIEGDTVGLDADAKLDGHQAVVYSGGLLLTRIFVNNETKLFKIPNDPSDENGYSVSGAMEGGLSYDSFNALEVGVQLYDVNESRQCGAMILRYDISEEIDGEEGLSGSVPIGLVTRVTRVLDEDGMEQTAVKILNWSGQEVMAYAPDDFECLYKIANADVANDPAPYVKNNGRKEYIISREEGVADAQWHDNGSRKDLYMSSDDLNPGDLIQYQISDSGTLVAASIRYRAEYPGNVELLAAKAKFTFTNTTDRNYYGHTIMNGVVSKKLDSGFEVDVNLPDGLGRPTEVKALRVIPAGGRFVVWDSEKQTATQIEARGVYPEDVVVAVWRTYTPMMTVVYR